MFTDVSEEYTATVISQKTVFFAILIAAKSLDFAVVFVLNVCPVLCYRLYILACSMNLVHALSKCSGNSPCLHLNFRVFQREFIRARVCERNRELEIDRDRERKRAVG